MGACAQVRRSSAGLFTIHLLVGKTPGGLSI
jgi:hypothetical protein